MIQEQKTAVIKSVTIGFVDHYKDLMLSCSFDMNSTVTKLNFTMDETKQMMKDAKIYNSFESLVGLPCEIYIDSYNTCHFKGMWKK